MIDKAMVQELLTKLKALGYDCQLVGGAAYTLYTEDSATRIKDLDIRFPTALSPDDEQRFADVGIKLYRYLDVHEIGSYRDSVSHRPSTLNPEFIDRIKFLTKAKYKGVDVDLLAFNVDGIMNALDTFDISFNCIAYDGELFIEGSHYNADAGVWLKPIHPLRELRMLKKFAHKTFHNRATYI